MAVCIRKGRQIRKRRIRERKVLYTRGGNVRVKYETGHRARPSAHSLHIEYLNFSLRSLPGHVNRDDVDVRKSQNMLDASERARETGKESETPLPFYRGEDFR